MRTLSLKSYCFQVIGVGVARLGLRLGQRATDPEQRLITEARKGDRGAFDRLMLQHRDALMVFLRRRVDQGSVDDLCQETWLAAYERLGTYKDSGRFRAWIFGICIHKVRDHHRSWAKHRFEPEDEGAGYVPQEFNQVEVRESLRPVWNQLVECHREVLDLYYSAELTLPEISVAIGCNLNTVKYRFYRAHDQVALHMGEPNVRSVASLSNESSDMGIQNPSAGGN